jgi:class 3 adenylate cyclase/predicted ATPase
MTATSRFGERRVEEWLRSIGLGQYADVFRVERIGRDELADLTDQDLKELGLTIGERRRFLRAALELADETASARRPTLTERRPLTVMFVDLVGSSELVELLEPEDLLEVIRLYREFSGTAIARFGGTVAGLAGDGILAYFSYPATENDPERAIRAALAIVREIASLASPSPRPLQVRIGIATGRVVVSDLLAGGRADLRTVVGGPPNFAARLQAMAGPGGIAIAQETYERSGGLFVCEELGPVDVRGFAAPRQVWRVLHELSRSAMPPAGRQDGSGREPLTPFCGRQKELAAIEEAWARAVSGQGGAVLLVGEAGIGKSRLIETFLSRNRAKDRRVLHFTASPFDVDSPLQPFAAWLDAEFNADEPARTHLADLLGIGEPAGESPAQLRERVLSALTFRVLGLSREEPLCHVVEDLHWLDPSSLEVISRLIASSGRHRILLLLAARDSFVVPWEAGAEVRMLTLGRLAAEDVTEMASSVLGHAELRPDIHERIIRRSDGVPLFVVELLRGLMLPQGTAILRALPDEPEPDIPARVRELLMARLDRAGFAKEVAQIAAVIGRSVRPATLAAVAGVPEQHLEAPLSALVDAGVLVRDGHGHDAPYSFSHALLRDASYDSLLRDQRRALHRRAATVYVRDDPKTVEQQPELLALHLAEADCAEMAVPHWMEAARRSLARSALIEAKRLLRRGLASLDKAPDSASLTGLKLEMMALLGPVLIGVDGPGAEETQELYNAAWRLCQQQPGSPSFFPIYWGWWRTSGDTTDKRARAQALLGRAKLRADEGLLLQAHHCAWASHYFAGELAQACAHAKAGLTIYASGDYGDHARLYGNHDARVCAHFNLCEMFWQQGKAQQSLAQERKAIGWAKALNHLGSIVHALDCGLMRHAYRRDVRQVSAYADKLARLTVDHGLTDHYAKSTILKGWAIALSEDTVVGLRMLQEGIARERDIGTDEDFPEYLALLGEALIRAGRAEEAVAELAAALGDLVRSGLKSMVPDMLWVLGEATMAGYPKDAAAARSWFNQAINMAEEQGASFLVLRSALSAARLDLRLGATSAAAELLARARAAVVEDDGSSEMAEAANLLARYTRIGYPVGMCA